VTALADTLSSVLNARVSGLADLHGGCIARVVGGMAEGRGPFVAKIGDGSSDLSIEAQMLADLGRLTTLPVPAVWHDEPGLLVMERLPGTTGPGEHAQRHLAELLADLHGIEGPSFGYERPTLIGPLDQPNESDASWARFFARHRILAFAELARSRGSLSAAGFDIARRLADAIEAKPHRFIASNEPPVLIHGDLWSGNILSASGRVTGLIDPAIYYADREIELAFMGLFGCVGRAFFERYHELRPIAPGFFERRQGMYRIYPLLVHAALFGAGYGRQAVDAMNRVLSA
jgi:fructosamine-3-kinase